MNWINEDIIYNHLFIYDTITIITISNIIEYMRYFQLTPFLI